MPAPIELNSAAYEVTELTHRMSQPATLRFTIPSQAGDAEAIESRTAVKFVVGGVCWFYGKVLPTSRRVGASEEAVEYVAADALEWLGRNPCAEVNDWYNKTDDGGVFAYPSNYTLRQIVEAEFASIVGAGLLFSALDWSSVPTAVQDLIVYDFEAKGKTFHGLLEALANEIPVLGWWVDPTACTFGSPIGGPVLRFYDLSAVPASPKQAVLRPVDGSSDPGTNVEAVEVTEDISASYDTLTIFGLGDLEELYEKATAEWVDWAAAFSQTLREDPTTGAVQFFVPGGGGGSWVTDSDAVADAARPWWPGSTRSGTRFVYRRYSVSQEIIDLKLQRDSSSSPATWVRVEPAITCEVLAHQWQTGPLGFVIGTTFYSGQLIGGQTKAIPYTNGVVDDYGDVVPIPLLYPNYPLDPLVPRAVIGPPEAFDKNYLLLAEHQARQCNYRFTSNVSGNTNYDNLVGASSHCYRFFPTGADVWVRYTGKSELSVTRTDPLLGYEKELRLYDQRFIRYTNLDGTVIRDDTSVLLAYADMMFALVSRKRLTGRVVLNANPASVMTAWPMGCGVQLVNWNGGAYTLPARVQQVTLTECRDRWRVEVAFDRPTTFAALDKSKEFRQFFRNSEAKGQQNLRTGSRGQNLLGGGGGSRPDGGNGNGGRPQQPFIDGGAVTSDPSDAPGNPAKYRQGQVAAIQLLSGGTNPGPASRIRYQIDVPYTGAEGAVRFEQVEPCQDRRDDADGAIIAAPVGSFVVVFWEADTPKFFVPELDYGGLNCTS